MGWVQPLVLDLEAIIDIGAGVGIDESMADFAMEAIARRQPAEASTEIFNMNMIIAAAP